MNYPQLPPSSEAIRGCPTLSKRVIMQLWRHFLSQKYPSQFKSITITGTCACLLVLSSLNTKTAAIPALYQLTTQKSPVTPASQTLQKSHVLCNSVHTMRFCVSRGFASLSENEYILWQNQWEDRSGTSTFLLFKFRQGSSISWHLPHPVPGTE